MPTNCSAKTHSCSSLTPLPTSKVAAPSSHRTSCNYRPSSSSRLCLRIPLSLMLSIKVWPQLNRLLRIALKCPWIWQAFKLLPPSLGITLLRASSWTQLVRHPSLLQPRMANLWSTMVKIHFRECFRTGKGAPHHFKAKNYSSRSFPPRVNQK